MGPLPRSARGFRYILVLLDYATRYPEAIPLQGMQAQGTAQALMRFFKSRVTLVDTDGQGNNVDFGVDETTLSTVRNTADFTTIYHPQTDGLVERMN